MKKLLFVTLILQGIGVVFGFFSLLATSFLLAVVELMLGLLGMIPIFAIIRNMEDIEDLDFKLYSLKRDVLLLEEQVNPRTDIEHTYEVPVAHHGEKAKGSWECVKCNTVNKENTERCLNCGAVYSSIYNPTSNPAEKKQVSRWIKEKKTKK
ncbi:MAG: hypothetical protein J6V50_06225 [Clostridia bacterium]|nr:hypothetical protein [Clostridia bacterium]